MARVMMEQVFQEPFSDERYADFAKKLDSCLEVRSGAWRRSSLSIDRLRMVCEFEAPDAEAVRDAARTAGIPYERVWTANVYAVEDYPEMMNKLRAVLAGKAPATAAAAQPESNEETTAAWNGVLFDKFVRFREVITRGFARHSEAALRRRPPSKGARVLDVGCGFGDVTSAIARAVGPSGMASGVDVAQRFVDSARSDAEQEGLANTRFFRADVQTDDVGGPYDMVFSRFGTMFFASPVAALRNLKAALKPEGRLCMVVWRRKEDNAWVHVPEKVVRELVPENHDSDEPTCGPGPFSMASADVTGEILTRAGFRDISFERYDAPIRIGRDVGEAVEWSMALGPAGEILRLAGQDGERRKPAVISALKEALAPSLTADGVVMASSVWIVTAL
jgi:ubiquinone/menaquinone biosynthesis C-methylase UbiE